MWWALGHKPDLPKRDCCVKQLLAELHGHLQHLQLGVTLLRVAAAPGAPAVAADCGDQPLRDAALTLCDTCCRDKGRSPPWGWL